MSVQSKDLSPPRESPLEDFLSDSDTTLSVFESSLTDVSSLTDDMEEFHLDTDNKTVCDSSLIHSPKVSSLDHSELCAEAIQALKVQLLEGIHLLQLDYKKSIKQVTSYQKDQLGLLKKMLKELKSKNTSSDLVKQVQHLNLTGFDLHICPMGLSYFAAEELTTPPVYDVCKQDRSTSIPQLIHCPRCNEQVSLHTCHNCHRITKPFEPCAHCGILPIHHTCPKCKYVLLTNLSKYSVLKQTTKSSTKVSQTLQPTKHPESTLAEAAQYLPDVKNPTLTTASSSTDKPRELNAAFIQLYLEQVSFVSDSCITFMTFDFWKDVCDLLYHTLHFKDYATNIPRWSPVTSQIESLLNYIFSTTSGIQPYLQLLLKLYDQTILKFPTLLNLVLHIRYLQHCHLTEKEGCFRHLNSAQQSESQACLKLTELVAVLTMSALYRDIYPVTYVTVLTDEISKMILPSFLKRQKVQQLIQKANVLQNHLCQCTYHASYPVPGPFTPGHVPSKVIFDHDTLNNYPLVPRVILFKLYMASAARHVFMGMHNLPNQFLLDINPMDISFTNPLPPIKGFDLSYPDQTLRLRILHRYPDMTEDDWSSIEHKLHHFQACSFYRAYYIFQHIESSVLIV